MKLRLGSLMTRLVVYFLVLSSLVVVLLGLVSYASFLQDIRRSVTQRLQAVAAVKEGIIERWIDESVSEVRQWTALPGVSERVETLFGTDPSAPGFRSAYAYLRSLFLSMQRFRGNYSEILLLTDRGGRVVLSTRPEHEGDYRVLDRFFVRGKERISIQKVHPSPVTLRPTITISYPLRGSSGGRIGVFAANLDLKRLDEVLQGRTGLGKSGEAYLVDRYNTLVSGERFGTEEYPRGVHSEGIERALSKQSGSGSYVNYHGERVLGVFSWVEDPGVALLVEIETAEAFGRARQRLLTVLLIGLAAVALLAVGVYILAGRIAGPVLAIKEAALRVAAGDLEATAPVETGDEIGVLAGTFNTMTERLKELYNGILSSEHRYRSFVEEDLTGDYIASPDGLILSCNPAFRRILGFETDEEAAAHNLFSLFSDSETADGFVRRLREEAKVEYFECGMLRTDGMRIHIIQNAIGRFAENGELREIQGYMFDNTERMRLEESLRHMQKMEAIGRLAGGIAHDFNNLLMAILGYSELLLDARNLDDDARGQVQEIERAARRAASLTQQLLAYSRKQIMQPRVSDINTLVRGMKTMLERLVGETIEVAARLDPQVSPVRIDPSQIEQVVMNLVLNSRDAMPGRGAITIETANVFLTRASLEDAPEVTPGPYVALTITDTGVGMDEQTREKAFDPFFTTKEVGKGTGLGLSTVYGIVKQSSGHVTVESEPGRGSRLSIYLPAHTGAAERERRSAGRNELRRGAETVLVVEDEEIVRKMMTRILRGLGYRVRSVENPCRALETVDRERLERLDLLITDVVMPQMSGPELAERLLRVNRNLRVIFISGYSGHALPDDLLARSGARFLRKPFTSQELSRAIAAVLEDSPGGPSAPTPC